MKQLFTDQMQRTMQVEFPPRRIVSLVPSQTELLYDLGLRDEVAGQTLFCIHPAEMHDSKPRIGGTKKLNMEKIAALQPDLIIGNKEENEQSQIEELMQRYPVWMSDIQTLGDALDMIGRVGALVNRKESAMQLVAEITNGFNALQQAARPLRTAYFIWRKPWMAAGHDTFINDMLKRCGWMNVFEQLPSRYPEVSDEQIAEAAPQLILLSSEPYPFRDTHIEELRALCPAARIMLVDGELFSWYGSRLNRSAAYFNHLQNSLQTGA